MVTAIYRGSTAGIFNDMISYNHKYIIPYNTKRDLHIFFTKRLKKMLQERTFNMLCLLNSSTGNVQHQGRLEDVVRDLFLGEGINFSIS